DPGQPLETVPAAARVLVDRHGSPVVDRVAEDRGQVFRHDLARRHREDPLLLERALDEVGDVILDEADRADPARHADVAHERHDRPRQPFPRIAGVARAWLTRAWLTRAWSTSARVEQRRGPQVTLR